MAHSFSNNISKSIYEPKISKDDLSSRVDNPATKSATHQKQSAITSFEQNNKIHQQACTDEFKTMPVSPLLAIIGNHLQVPHLKSENCLYIHNISVRAEADEISELLFDFGQLILFEFILKDKQLRFQSGIAIFAHPISLDGEIKKRPFVICKRKIKMTELAYRNNASIVLSILARKLGLSDVQEPDRVQNIELLQGQKMNTKFSNGFDFNQNSYTNNGEASTIEAFHIFDKTSSRTAGKGAQSKTLSRVYADFNRDY